MINIYSPLQHGLGNWIEDANESSFQEADIVLIPGGSDVNPKYYGHERLPSTYVSTASDVQEMALIDQAIEAGKLIVGICKGSQMLTARAGGWLIQDVSNHGGIHEMETYDGKTLKVNSTHHQMSYPFDLPKEDYSLLGWATNRSTKYRIQGEKDLYPEFGAQEPEVIWYPKIKGFGIQFHPEWGSCPQEAVDWANQEILKVL